MKSFLKPYPAGIRDQAVMGDGSLVHDFLFTESERSFHVRNAPSSAATSNRKVSSNMYRNSPKSQDFRGG